MQCGPIVEPPNDPNSQSLIAYRELCVKNTNFSLPLHVATPSINELYEALTHDTARNQLIVQDVIAAASNGAFPLVLTERIEHIEVLKRLLSACSYPIIVLKGGMRAKERRTALAQLAKDSSPRILLATGRYIGEGFDHAPLDSLFLALPISWTGTLQQYAGRLHRHHKDKARVVVYDYVDTSVPILQRMFRRRLRGYRAMGYLDSKAPGFNI
jgi:superfamily II DNA or RNA helicase